MMLVTAKSPFCLFTAQPTGNPVGSVKVLSCEPVRDNWMIWSVPVLVTQTFPAASLHMPCGSLKPVRPPLASAPSLASCKC